MADKILFVGRNGTDLRSSSAVFQNLRHSSSDWRTALCFLLLTITSCYSPQLSLAQQPAAAPRVAVVSVFFTRESVEVKAFQQALLEAGYVEGRDIIFDWYAVGGDYGRLPSVVDTAVRNRPAVIVVETTRAALTAKEATSTIPIVMAIAGDPLGAGLVDSLSRPGRNLTGMSMMMDQIAVKRLQLLAEAVPGARRIGLLWDPTAPFHAKAVEESTRWARSAGIQLTPVSASKPAEFEAAFGQLERARVQALCVFDNAFFAAQRTRILGLANVANLPVAYGYRPWLSAGAFLSYTADFADTYRRAAGYVDKILKGAKPSELPVEQAAKFDLVINVRVAKALGLSVPDSLLVRADEVIR